MTDCPNADIRDRLPELVSGTLTGEGRVVVQAHLDTCEDCRAEVELLHDMRAMLVAATPVVNVQRISAAIAAYDPPQRTRQVRWVSWRVAATVAFMAIGASTLITLQNARHGHAATDSLAMTSSTSDKSPELGMTGQLQDLTATQLQALIDGIDNLDALPPLDPDHGGMNGVVPTPPDSSDVGGSGSSGSQLDGAGIR